MFIRSWSFSALRASFLVVLLIAACAIGASVWRDRAHAIENNMRDAHDVAVVMAAQLERTIRSIDVVLRGVQRQVGQMDIQTPTGETRIPDAYTFRMGLLAQLALVPQAFQIAVTDARGQIILSTAAWPTPRIDVADRAYFAELKAADDDQLRLSLPIRNRIDGEPTIVLARRVNGPDRRFLGIVFVSVEACYFKSIYRSVKGLNNQTFVLARPDGTVLARYPDSPGPGGGRMAADAAFPAVRAGGESFGPAGAFDGTARWRAVELQGNHAPLVVGIGVPEDVILAKWRERTASVLAGTAVTLICALALLQIMTRQYLGLSASQRSLAEKSQALEHEHAMLVQQEALLQQEHARVLDSEAMLRVQNARFDTAINSMSQGLAMFGADARLVVCNGRYREMLGISPEMAVPGRSLREIITYGHDQNGVPADVDATEASIVAMIASGRPTEHELRNMDGRLLTVKNAPRPGGGWVVTFEDITDRRAAELKIERLAHQDILTGIANRPCFLERIETARQRLQANGQPFSVLMLDLDRFKNVNDTLGHPAGDKLLKETAARLQTTLRSTDVLARLGGDEFAVIQAEPRDFDSVSDPLSIMRESAIVLASRILDVIGRPYDIDGHKVVVGASIGIAMAPNDAVEPDELMKKADLALYQTKSQGRNGYSFFDVTMSAAADERRKLETEFREGLERDELEIHWQPLIDLATGRPCAMEALVRWHHPEHGLVSPDRFIALAEDTGLVNAMGERVMHAACAAAAKWPPDVKVAVNLSPVQFRRGELVDVIICALVDSGLAPDRLEVEITERVLLEKESDNISMLHQLKNIGISIALDDFGTGYSSLGFLTTFPFDKVKIDRSLTHDILERSDRAAIACAIINLGRLLAIKTAAEGVETEAQLGILRAAGLEQAQGYLFGAPRPAAEVRFDDGPDRAADDAPGVRGEMGNAA